MSIGNSGPPTVVLYDVTSSSLEGEQTDDDKMAVTVEEALVAFARLCLLTYHVQDTAVTRFPTPDARQKAILDALGTPLPSPRSLRKM